VVASRLILAFGLALNLACAGDKPGDQAENSVASASADTHGTVTDPRAAIFLNKGCPQCHSISALGVKSPAEIGPDLTLAYEDVQTRFSMSLEEFLHNPTGTMQMVLSSQIQLSPAERDSIIHILKGLHEDREDDEDNDED
jgi:mono/diheme cytochrome c family protein